MKFQTPIRFEIDLAVLRYNLEQLQKETQESVELIVNLESNAYSLGLKPVAELLMNIGINWLSVSELYDAVRLRDIGISQNILMRYSNYPEISQDIVDYSLTPLIFSPETDLNELANCSQRNGKITPVHVNIDTCEHNVATLTKLINSLVSKVGSYKSLVLCGLSHCPTQFHELSQRDLQIEFNKFIEASRNIQASGIKIPYYHGSIYDFLHNTNIQLINLIRTESLMFGIKDINAMHLNRCNIQPAISLKAFVSNIYSTSYYHGFTTDESSPTLLVGTISFSRSDGLSAHLLNNGEVLIQGFRIKVIGLDEVGMYQVNLTNFPSVKVGEEVIIIGQQNNDFIGLEEIALKLHTTELEVFFQINHLTEKYYINNQII